MKCIASLSLLCAATASVAATAPSPTLPDDVLASLSKCDSSFFEALGQYADQLSSSKALVRANGIAYFKVPDRSAPGRTLQKFSSPIKANRVEITGYFDEVFALGDNGTFIAWGFVIKAPIAEVVKATQATVWDGDRVQHEGESYSRSELLNLAQPESGWQKVITPGSVDASDTTIERVLMIEPYEKDPSQTRFGCALHGPITPAVLKGARPDLDAKQLAVH